MKTEPPAGFYDYYDVWDVYDQYDQADDDKKVLTINWKFLRIMKIIFYWADRSLIFLAVFTNILQLIILTRKVMRHNFINVLLSAISVCDLIMMITKLWTEYSGPINGLDVCGASRTKIFLYFNTMHTFLYHSSQSWSIHLGLLMAFFRMLSVMFPMKKVVKRPRTAFFVIFGVVLFNLLFYSVHYVRYSVNNLKGKMSCLGQIYTTDMYEMYLNAGDGKLLERFHLVETMSHFVYIILYIIINVILAIQLRILRNQRKHVKDDGKTLIVFIFALLFFIHECFYGIVQLMMMFLAPHDVNYAYLVNRVMNLNSLLFIINSIFQSVIPFFLSSQYRKTARRLFWRKKKDIDSAVSVSTSRPGRNQPNVQ